MKARVNVLANRALNQVTWHTMVLDGTSLARTSDHKFEKLKGGGREGGEEVTCCMPVPVADQ